MMIHHQLLFRQPQIPLLLLHIRLPPEIHFPERFAAHSMLFRGALFVRQDMGKLSLRFFCVMGQPPTGGVSSGAIKSGEPKLTA